MPAVKAKTRSLGIRFTPQQEEIIEAWRKHLDDATPGLTFTMSDAVKSLIELSATVPDVRVAMSKGRR